MSRKGRLNERTKARLKSLEVAMGHVAQTIGQMGQQITDLAHGMQAMTKWLDVLEARFVAHGVVTAEEMDQAEKEEQAAEGEAGDERN